MQILLCDSRGVFGNGDFGWTVDDDIAFLEFDGMCFPLFNGGFVKRVPYNT